MSTIVSQQAVYDTLKFSEIGIIGTVDASGVASSGKKTADGTTVIDITINSAYNYKATTFKLTDSTKTDVTIPAANITFANHIISVTIPAPVDPAIPTSTEIKANVDYTMSFDLAS